MDQREQTALRECYTHLESSLDAQAISGTLFSKGIITMELMEELSLVHLTRFQKNGILLRYFLRNPVPNLISQLCDVLRMEEANRHLARTLQEAYDKQQGASATHQGAGGYGADGGSLDTKPSLSQLMEHVYPDITTHWLEVGIHLGIDDRELEAIEANRHKQANYLESATVWSQEGTA
ncbi:uncharacterized protein [Dysidea avara]|uniref:uncharacterized protein isoform X3 n=1 Tax=Dysidea avara TaxID=196820 RepID=UPI0033238A13